MYPLTREEIALQAFQRADSADKEARERHQQLTRDAGLAWEDVKAKSKARDDAADELLKLLGLERHCC